LFKPAERSTLYKEVTEQMLLAIKNGVWKVGDKIPSEMELAEKFQVGRNCIREATKSLAVSGILEARPGQGTFVSPVALRKIMAYELFDYMNEERAWIELMQVRAALEGDLAYLAAERATPEDIKKLEEIIARSVKQNGKYHPLDQEHLLVHSDFHEAIAEIAGNNFALKLLKSIKSEINEHRKKYWAFDEKVWEKMIRAHKQIVEYIANREPEKARHLMRKHLMESIEDYKKLKENSK